MQHSLRFVSWIALVACGGGKAGEDAACTGGKCDDDVPPVCDDADPLRRPLFGDLHIHTSFSFDAYLFENRSDPNAAYAFARGATIPLAPVGGTRTATIDRPLDFAAVTDHSEFLGEVATCLDPALPGYDAPLCRLYRENPQLAFATFGQVLADTNPQRPVFCGPGGANCIAAGKTVWSRERDAAAAANDTCAFTSFVAYEWTGTTAGNNLHRNVIFRSDVVPDLPISYYEQPTPDGLWRQLTDTCKTALPGCDVLAIPHNSNFSNGVMFAPQQANGAPFDVEAAQLRAATEPLVEVHQVKGDSECAPGGPDEECAFENPPRDPPSAPLSFVREALLAGMEVASTVGVNPFQLGFIGSTDTHNSTPGATAEAGYQGSHGTTDDTLAERLNLNEARSGINPGGLAVVWAEENTRESIFAALLRRETYATSGTRPIVRAFGGFDLPDSICSSPTLAGDGYAHGVPMGGVLPKPPRGAAAPRFVVSATRDPGTASEPSAPLERIQIVKGWIDGDGHSQERVFDIAGTPVIGANPQTCEQSTEGSAALCAVWQDPQWDPAQRAFYYARVLEAPSCRWTARTCVAMNVTCPNPPPGLAACCDPAIPRTQRERAWTSPIWFEP